VERCSLGEFSGAGWGRERGAADRIFFWLARLVNERGDSVRCAHRESWERSDDDPPHDASTVGAS
jgi:hypothetical protein